MIKNKKKNFLVLWWGVLLIGLFFRLLYWGLTNGEYLRDEITYLQRMEYVSKYGINSGTSNLFFQFLGVLLSESVREQCLRGFNCLFSGINLIVIYFFGKKLFNSKGDGLLLMLLAAFNPYTIRLSSSILREPLYLLVASIELLLCLTWMSSSKKWVVPWIAVVAVFGFWVRYEGLELLFIFLISWGYVFVTQKKKMMSDLMIYVLSYVLAMTALVVFVPHLVDHVIAKISIVLLS